MICEMYISEADKVASNKLVNKPAVSVHNIYNIEQDGDNIIQIVESNTRIITKKHAIANCAYTRGASCAAIEL